MGWTITTPLCVLDACRDVGPLDCLPLPFAGFERIIRIATWRDELGSLPEHIAAMVRSLMRRELEPEAIKLAPWLKQELEVLDPE